MVGMSTSTIPIVKLTSTAELLAFMPVLAGVPVRGSLVIAPFIGNRASRALRIPVEPSPSMETARTLASVALGALSKLDDCGSVSVAVYRDEPFDQIGPQWHEAFGVVLERLHQSGYHIKDAAIVAADGWIPYFEGDLAAPQPLAEIEEHAKRMPEVPRSDAVSTLPETDPELAQRVTDALFDRYIDQSERDSFGRLRPVAPADPVDFLENALADGPAEASALTLARLIAQIESEGAVDRTVLQLAFGRAAGAQSWSATLEVRAAAAESSVEPNDILMDRYERGIYSRQDERLGNLLTGQTRELPSPERLRAGAALLGRAIAHCPLPEKAWLMCAFAWVQWALGLSNAAHETIVSARRLAPGNSLAPMYHAMFDRLTPEWIFTSMPPNRAARRRAKKKYR